MRSLELTRELVEGRLGQLMSEEDRHRVEK